MTLAQAIEIVKNQHKKELKKLKRGLLAREVVKVALREGSDVDNSRTKWLSKTADMVILLLRDEARKYNRTHKNERMSLLDLGDALSTAKARLGIPAEAPVLSNAKKKED